MASSRTNPVLIAGADAIGLAVALGLARHGIAVVVLEAESRLVEEY